MKQQFNPSQICAYFGIDLMQEMHGLATEEAVRAKLEDIKERVNKIFKQRALTLHPDRNDGKDEQFKELSNMRDQALELAVFNQPPPPPRPPLQSQMRVRVRVYGPGFTSTTTSGTGSTYDDGMTSMFWTMYHG